jgi:hypothetical protein
MIRALAIHSRAIACSHFGSRILDFGLERNRTTAVFNPKSAIQNPKSRLRGSHAFALPYIAAGMPAANYATDDLIHCGGDQVAE